MRKEIKLLILSTALLDYRIFSPPLGLSLSLGLMASGQGILSQTTC
jgi:hypothetical protein